MQFERINPITNEAASSAGAMTAAEVWAVADEAAAAFPVWAAVGPNARRAILNKAAAALEARKDHLVANRGLGYVQPHAGGRHDS